jgi:hypothetical protein
MNHKFVKRLFAIMNRDFARAAGCVRPIPSDFLAV